MLESDRKTISNHNRSRTTEGVSLRLNSGRFNTRLLAQLIGTYGSGCVQESEKIPLYRMQLLARADWTSSIL
jgi:hypothetical protein